MNHWRVSCAARFRLTRPDPRGSLPSVDRTGIGPAAGNHVAPEDFLRSLLKISPEDAAEVREDAAKAMDPSSARGADTVDEQS